VAVGWPRHREGGEALRAEGEVERVQHGAGGGPLAGVPRRDHAPDHRGGVSAGGAGERAGAAVGCRQRPAPAAHPPGVARLGVARRVGVGPVPGARRGAVVGLVRRVRELSFEGTGLQLQMRGSHNVFQLWLCPNQTPRAPETDPRAALWAALARHDCRDQPALPRPSGCWGRLTGSARERWREVAGAGAGGLRQRVLSTGHWETNATTYTAAEGLPWGRYSVRIAMRTGFDGNLYGCVTLTAARALGQAAAGAAADGRQPSLLQLGEPGEPRRSSPAGPSSCEVRAQRL